jgi:phosphoenolpyruvate---glycerone phosphotransferase subunit DhaL
VVKTADSLTTDDAAETQRAPRVPRRPPPARPEPATAAIDTVDLRMVVTYLTRVRSLVHRYHGLLTRLDTALGDGDHGDNVVAGFDAIESLLRDETYDSIGEILSAVGRVLASSLGGASGSLYGSAFMAAGLAAGEAVTVEARAVGPLLQAGAAAIARRGHCKVGDKTMYDTVKPASDAFVAATAHSASALEAIFEAVAAGRSGMASTRNLTARRGLAIRLGARSVGHVDPGAVSAFVLLVALVPPGVGTGLRKSLPSSVAATGEGSGGPSQGARP